MKGKQLIATVLFLTVSMFTYGQELTIQSVQAELSSDQVSEIERAERGLERIQVFISRAEAIEAEYADIRNSDKKRLQNRFERKTWDAKRSRITAAISHLRAYSAAVSVYSDFLEAAEFLDENDRQQALKLNEQAQKNIADVEKSLAPYDDAEKKREFRKDIVHSKLLSDIRKAEQSQKEALKKQEQAIALYLDQAAKKELEEKDNQAWRRAKQVHTIPAYYEYLDEFPGGKYAGEAKKIIAELEEAERIREEERRRKEAEGKTPEDEASDYTYRVQIAAAKTRIPDNELKALHSNLSEISMERSRGYFKYRVGVFSTYEQARQYRDEKRKTTVPRAFVVRFDKDGKQIGVEK